jgi:hypothetical protein
MKHVDAIEGLPTIGETYLVKSIKADCQRLGIITVPVVGTFHEDKYYFGVDWRHWHFDARFISGDQENFILEWEMKKLPQYILGYAVHKNDVKSEPFDAPFECVRQTPVFHFDGCSDMAGPLQKKLPENRRKLVGKCLRCPHRGTQLSGVEERNGLIVCPAHGLAFDAKTKVIVDRSYEDDPAKCVLQPL